MTEREPAVRAEREALLARLGEARAALLRALEGLTERDFAAPLDDGEESVAAALARLVAEERRVVARARGGEAETRMPERPLPPQVTHGLAGTQYEARRLVDDGGVASETAREAVEEIVRLEAQVAGRIEARKRA